MKLKWNKYTILLFIGLLGILLLLPKCFEKEKCVYSLLGEDITNTPQYQSEYITLTPGVYQIRAKGSVSDGSSFFLEIKNDTGSFKALRGNGVMYQPNQEFLDFEVYVFDTIPTAYLECTFYGTDAQSLTRLDIYKVNWGGRMLLLCFLAVLTALYFLLRFRDGILNGKISRDKQIVFWVLLGCIMLSYFPYLTDYCTIGADTVFHLLRIEGLKETLLQGTSFPVRVQGYWLYDHGYAVSTFYPDFFLTIPAFLRLMGFSLMTSYKAYVLLMMVATALIAYFSFYQCTKKRNAALFGSVMYMLAPYRIYNFYNRGAVGEYTAMVFFPLICCGLYLLYTGEPMQKEYRRNKWYLIAGLTGILQCHILSTEMTVCMILFICVLLWKKTFRPQTFLQLAQAGGLSLLLNCWFWLPMLYMMGKDEYVFHNIVNQGIQSRGTQFAGIFQLFPYVGSAQTGMYHCEPIQIGAGALLMLVLFAVIAFRKRNNPYQRICRLLLCLIVLTVFMGTKYFPWDLLAKIPGIQYLITSLQFPTRLLAPASVLCAMFAVFFFLWLKEEGSATLLKGALFTICLITTFSAIYHVNDIAFETSATRLYTAENMGNISVSNAEYCLKDIYGTNYYSHSLRADEGLVWTDYEKRGTNITIYVENPTNQLHYMEFPLIGYRGYTAKAVAKESNPSPAELPYICEERGEHGDLKLAVPAGYCGNIRISYQGFPIFRIAEAVSLVTILAIILFYLSMGFRQKTGKRHGISAQQPAQNGVNHG